MNKKNKKNLIFEAKIAWQYQQIDRALWVLQQIEDPRIAEGFDKDWIKGLKNRMEWVIFPTLGQDEQLEMISNDLLLPLLDKNFNLKKIFDITHATSLPAVWPDYVPKILDAFLKNEQRLGKKDIVLKNGQKVRPTIGNWVKTYVDVHGLDKKDEMTVITFLNNSPNYQNISEDYKKTVKKLLVVFESIKVITIKQILNEMKRQGGLPGQEQIDPQKQEAKDSQTAPNQEEKSQKKLSPFLKRLRQSQVQQSGYLSEQEGGAQNQNIPEPQVQAQEKPQTRSPQSSFPNQTGSQKQNKTKTIKISINEALRAVPQVADQIITSKPLYRLGQPGTVPPTIENWLLDYRTRYGISGHNEEDQRNYLHNSPNVQTLNPKELKKVAQLILSYDQNAPLDVLPNQGKIVFNN
ncbi:MAG: hypothetical protein GF335_04295 [Candidatus Moranbacteria bacterium]|nr:hypothetical protein [Candidatus Moranbacteria bacterium]